MKLYLTLLSIFFASTLFCQSDSIYLQYNGDLEIKRRDWLPSIEVFSTNFIINRYDYWYQGEEWANVNWNSWRVNVRRSPRPDDNKFKTNFLLHPIHGSLFYNSARSSGQSYWTSIPYVLGGSLMWEFLGETYAASEIDLYTTFIGGVYLGELTHRLSAHLLYDDKNRPFRIVRNSAATVLNPIGQFNQLINKETANAFRNGHQLNFPIRSQITVGNNFSFGQVHDKIMDARVHINYTMLYGDLFYSTKKFHPFDFFILKSWVDISLVKSDVPIYFNLVSHAPIYRQWIGENSIFAISQHYDYLHNQVFKLGGMSFTADYVYQKAKPHWNMMGAIKAGPIIFGSTTSEAAALIIYENDFENYRDYLYGSGFALEAELFLNSKVLGQINSNYNLWILFPRRDAEGVEASRIFRVNYYYPFWKNSSLGFELFHYRRKASYEGYPEFEDIRDQYFELKLLWSYRF